MPFYRTVKREAHGFGRGTQLQYGLPLVLQEDVTAPGSVPSPLRVQRSPFCVACFANVSVTCAACVTRFQYELEQCVSEALFPCSSFKMDF